MKIGTKGQIVGGGLLAGVSAILLRQNLNGYLVVLTQDKGAYKVGDRVQVGAGEFRSWVKEVSRG